MTFAAQHSAAVNASAPLGDLDRGDYYPPSYTCDRNGRWPHTEARQAALWARACADAGDTFARFLALLESDGALGPWGAVMPTRELYRIWSAPEYRPPAHWSGTIIGVDGAALDRWEWLCAPLRPEDAIWHRIPNGEEDSFVAALDWLLWDGTGRKGKKPLTACVGEGAELKRVVHAAMRLKDRWPDWKGTPWRVVAHARRASFAAWEKEWPARRAGERLTFNRPEPQFRKSIAEMRAAGLRKFRRR